MEAGEKPSLSFSLLRWSQGAAVERSQQSQYADQEAGLGRQNSGTLPCQLTLQQRLVAALPSLGSQHGTAHHYFTRQGLQGLALLCLPALSRCLLA